MRKLNYIVDKNNILIEYHEIPFDKTKPFIEVPNNISLHVGLDKVVNGELISADEIVKNQNRILELKDALAKTDYLCLKFADGAISEEEYAPIRVLRQSYRDQINELELSISSLN
jgi:hypothetical protein